MIALSPAHSVSYDGCVLHTYHADVGEGLPRHSHDHSHLTTVHAGRAIIRKEGKSLEMTKHTQPVNLVAGEWHEIEALEPGTVFVNVFRAGKL